MNFIKHTFTVILLAIFSISSAQQKLDNSVKFPNHPRLLCLNGQEKAISANIKANAVWQKVHQTILATCNEIISEPPVRQIKIGRRLLDKSRTCLLRVFYLSYAYRITKENKYLMRAEAEMLAAAAFTDWNPSHFLDVGEMTMALSIGYDWLYNDLPQSSRLLIKEAILKKGIEPSLDKKYNGWLTSKSNWNQVCNAGIAYGAMATYEDHPELSIEVINRAIASMALPMQQYAPDGGYPEGYMYWEYGTSFNVMFLSALQTAFGNDFGMSAMPGFMQTASFIEHLSGTSGKPFNYGDCGNSGHFSPVVFWFANRNNDPTLLWVEKKSLTGNDSTKQNLLPAAIIWGSGIKMDKISAPKDNAWVGRGENTVALLRTSWTRANAIFVGFKTGSPSASHGHMDVGSFVMDADGVRWAMDFGMQAYETLESKSIDLWNMKQSSQRWKVFRYNNLAHNTIAINNGLQQVGGNAIINSSSTRPSFLNAVSDLTKVYDSSLRKIIRGVAIVDEQYVVVRDEVETLADVTKYRWSMVTQAQVRIVNDTLAELTHSGKKLRLKIQGPAGTRLTTWSTKPTTKYDAQNPGTVILGFEVDLLPNSKHSISVILQPNNKTNVDLEAIPALEFWPGE